MARALGLIAFGVKHFPWWLAACNDTYRLDSTIEAWAVSRHLTPSTLPKIGEQQSASTSLALVAPLGYLRDEVTDMRLGAGGGGRGRGDARRMWVATCAEVEHTAPAFRGNDPYATDEWPRPAWSGPPAVVALAPVPCSAIGDDPRSITRGSGIRRRALQQHGQPQCPATTSIEFARECFRGRRDDRRGRTGESQDAATRGRPEERTW
eukprot:scaffold37730_cov28-Tisochrysis_lutea.AAC.2